MNGRRLSSLVLASALATLLSLTSLPSHAQATTTCAFVPAVIGQSMVLADNCTTDETFFVPNGITLDGNGHTITAMDPAVGHFIGAVIRNDPSATVIYVTNLNINGSFTIDACDGGNDRLRGILFDGAGGTVTNVQVVDIRQGTHSGCQEGNAIEVRNFDANLNAATPRVQVTISDNVVRRYQKTGIIANGGVDAIIGRNIVEGVGPVDFIAQNGIQIGFGATALVTANSVSRNNYTPNTFFACGILIVEAGGVDAKPQDNSFPATNDPNANEKDLCAFHKGGNYTPFGS